MKPKISFVVWSKHSPRAVSMATALGTQVELQYDTKLKKRWQTPLRYWIQTWRSWQLLEREHPDIVIVRTPPVFAPLAALAWCAWRGKRFVMDCDTGSFHSPKWQWALPLHRWLARHAILALVIDQAAFDTLQAAGAKVMIFRDRLPEMVLPTSAIGSAGATRIAVISSFDVDEPIAATFVAARLLPEITFYCTGDPKRADASLLLDKPANVVLTGYLRGGDYTGLLNNVDGLVVLTNEQHALNCGAYEALSIQKPAVVSDWPEMRHYFSRGFVHVLNQPEAIAAGIQTMLAEQPVLREEIAVLRIERSLEWERNFETIKSFLANYNDPDVFLTGGDSSSQPILPETAKTY